MDSRNLSPNGTKQQNVGLILLMSSPLDCESLSEQFSRREGTTVLAALHDLQLGLQRVGMHRPHVVIFDPKNHLSSVKPVLSLVEGGFIGQLIILDDRVREGLLLEVLNTPRCSYITRDWGFAAIHSTVITAVKNSRRVFDPLIEERLIRNRSGLALTSPPDKCSIASLTPREIDVLKMVALGFSVRDCAEHLKVSSSTIDNHKARLMKKLNIHKVPKLTRLAIREGLISA